MSVEQIWAGHVIPELIKKIRKLKSNNKLVIQGSATNKIFYSIDDFVER